MRGVPREPPRGEKAPPGAPTKAKAGIMMQPAVNAPTTSAPSEAVDSETVKAAPLEEAKLVAEQFAFDYDKVADEVQLIGDDLFGVLAPRQLHKLRPRHRHAWACKICGYASNWSDENTACMKCGRSRDPEWLQVPGAGGDLGLPGTVCV